MDQFQPPVKDMIFCPKEVVGKGELDSNLGFEDFDREFLETIYESASEITSKSLLQLIKMVIGMGSLLKMAKSQYQMVMQKHMMLMSMGDGQH